MLLRPADVSQIQHLGFEKPLPVNTKSLFRNLKLSGSVPKAQERQHPDKNPDSPSLSTFERSNIHRLAIVSKPVTEIDSFDHHAGPFVAFDKGNGFEHVFYITMAPLAVLRVSIGSLLREHSSMTYLRSNCGAGIDS